MSWHRHLTRHIPSSMKPAGDVIPCSSTSLVAGVIRAPVIAFEGFSSIWFRLVTATAASLTEFMWTVGCTHDAALWADGVRRSGLSPAVDVFRSEFWKGFSSSLMVP